MDKKETYVAIAGIIVVGILMFFAGYLYNNSQRLQTILDDRIAGNCPYEGSECPNAKAAMKDYQLVLQDHDYVLMQGERTVAVIQRGGEIDSLVTLDNQ